MHPKGTWRPISDLFTREKRGKRNHRQFSNCLHFSVLFSLEIFEKDKGVYFYEIFQIPIHNYFVLNSRDNDKPELTKNPICVEYSPAFLEVLMNAMPGWKSSGLYWTVVVRTPSKEWTCNSFWVMKESTSLSTGKSTIHACKLNTYSLN